MFDPSLAEAVVDERGHSLLAHEGVRVRLEKIRAILHLTTTLCLFCFVFCFCLFFVFVCSIVRFLFGFFLVFLYRRPLQTRESFGCLVAVHQCQLGECPSFHLYVLFERSSLVCSSTCCRGCWLDLKKLQIRMGKNSGPSRASSFLLRFVPSHIHATP